jgi:hypothetical protein
MKHLRLLLASILLVGGTAMAADTTLNGSWKIHTDIAGNEGDQVCTFTQEDATLTGSCKGDDGASHDLTGKIDGKKVTWQYKSEYNGDPLTLVFAGTLDSDSAFSGTVDVQPLGVDGTFTAKKST